ncbi:hypothetical protein OV203_50230 [Nannocystis sp. ILAH1]|uniref:hypothetical protein n=1 Tax=Nannocystis sp. ILAH1 TaxID=2996789 RepID=UPI00226D8A64|nr:hypothetical protein [Nannocystis sp. ILAH1]MCY0995404.1 hypothetical protein [Nannocystis sp. ILAH1]
MATTMKFGAWQSSSSASIGIGYGKYHVAGCGQKGVYSAQCLMGDCSAQRLQGE